MSSSSSTTIPLRPFSLIGEAVSDAIEAELVMRTHLVLKYGNRKKFMMKQQKQHNTNNKLHHQKSNNNTITSPSSSSSSILQFHSPSASRLDEYLSHAICYKCNQTQDTLVLPSYFLPTSLINILRPSTPSHKVIRIKVNTKRFKEDTTGETTTTDEENEGTRNNNSSAGSLLNNNPSSSSSLGNSVSTSSSNRQASSSSIMGWRAKRLTDQIDFLPTSSSAQHRFVRPIAHTVVGADQSPLQMRLFARRLVFADEASATNRLLGPE